MHGEIGRMSQHHRRAGGAAAIREIETQQLPHIQAAVRATIYTHDHAKQLGVFLKALAAAWDDAIKEERRLNLLNVSLPGVPHTPEEPGDPSRR